MAETIRDTHGTIIGYEERDGALRDRNRKRIGYRDRKDGTIRDRDGEVVGSIDNNGIVRDQFGRHVGSIAPNKAVQDWQGVDIGTGSGTQLLLDFEQFTKQEPASPREMIANTLIQEGFVSPSVLGCLGLVGAVIVGAVIMFYLNNPPNFGRPGLTPTAAVANVTAEATSAAGTPDAPEPTAEPEADLTGTVNADSLNLRSGPGTTFSVLDRLGTGTLVTLTGRNADSSWLQVTVPSISKNGWVSAQYVDTEAALADLPVVETQ
jgi:hypothetical protein